MNVNLANIFFWAGSENRVFLRATKDPVKLSNDKIKEGNENLAFFMEMVWLNTPGMSQVIKNLKY